MPATLNPAAPRACSICASYTRREVVDRKLAEGFSPHSIEKWTRTPEAQDIGIRPIKGETIYAHLKRCLAAAMPESATKEQRVEVGVMAAKVSSGLADPDDLAVLIRTQVAAKARAGELRLTAQHGLQAQQMLDRREEKKAGRELATQLARLLNNTFPPVNVLPPVRVVGEVIIEGEAVEVG